MTAGDQFTVAESGRIRLRHTQESDLAYVLGAEADSENAAFILCWSAEQHLAAISDPGCAHWIIEDRAAGRAVGYVILSALESPHHSVEFNRITVTEKGKGFGREALRLVKRVAFEQLGAHRLWLDVVTENTRAHGLYRSEGFIEEGCLRECLIIGGRRVSLIVLSMLRQEYAGN